MVGVLACASACFKGDLSGASRRPWNGRVLAHGGRSSKGGARSAAKEAGKWRLEGKDYIVKDGDVMHFRFNV